MNDQPTSCKAPLARLSSQRPIHCPSPTSLPTVLLGLCPQLRQTSTAQEQSIPVKRIGAGLSSLKNKGKGKQARKTGKLRQRLQLDQRPQIGSPPVNFLHSFSAPNPNPLFITQFGPRPSAAPKVKRAARSPAPNLDRDYLLDQKSNQPPEIRDTKTRIPKRKQKPRNNTPIQQRQNQWSAFLSTFILNLNA